MNAIIRALVYKNMCWAPTHQFGAARGKSSSTSHGAFSSTPSSPSIATLMQSVCLLSRKLSIEPGGRLAKPFFFAWFLPTHSCCIGRMVSEPFVSRIRAAEIHIRCLCGRNNAGAALPFRQRVADARSRHFGRQKWCLGYILAGHESRGCRCRWERSISRYRRLLLTKGSNQQD
jgi:hypothetical protein